MFSSIFWVREDRDQTFSKNVENKQRFQKRSMDEGREKCDEQSAPSADNSAAPAVTKRHNIVSTKAGQNLDRSGASKVDLMREANASLTLVAEIMHIDQEYWGILLTKPHNIGPVQSSVQDTLSSTTIRSRSTKRNHPPKLFQFGINVE